MIKTVLVVDDDETIRDVVRLTLECEGGYRVLEADNGIPALAAVAGNPVDLIILDLRMPEMDGWAFERELSRRMPNKPPILVFTAAVDSLSRASAVQAQGYLTKPFELNELLTMVHQILGRT